MAFWNKPGKTGKKNKDVTKEGSAGDQVGAETAGSKMSADSTNKVNGSAEDTAEESRNYETESEGVAAELNSAAELDSSRANDSGKQDGSNAELSAEQLHIQKLEAEVKENQDKYLRALAEADNIRKRAIKERSDLLKYAGESLARDVLEVQDDLERALGQAPGADGKSSAEIGDATRSFIEGVRMVQEKFRSILERHSIRSQPSVGTQLDPTKHEALASVPHPDKQPGEIIEEFKRAYFFKDKLLRPAQVVVAVKPPESAASSSASSGDGTNS